MNEKLISDYYHFTELYDRLIYRKKIGIQKNFTIQELKIKINNLSNIYNKNKEQMVFADGNPKSNLMIIGEAPGANEEKFNRPFVGEAGKLLDKMLSAINLNRDSVYITNVINYRPPDNRKPTPDEINLFLPYLKEHIQLINPRLILLLGSTALEAFFNKEYSITKIRGTWLKIKIKNKVFNCLPSFHPAFLLRQPEQKKQSWTDLQIIRDSLKEIEKA